MDGLIAFLDMGGHGAFIWSAYGVAVLVLGGLLAASRSELRRRERTLEGLEGHEGRRRRR